MVEGVDQSPYSLTATQRDKLPEINVLSENERKNMTEDGED